MIVGEVCSREVYFVRREEPLAEAVREMKNRNVGAVVVADWAGEQLRPVGIMTDRDVVYGQIARQADLFCLAVSDVMTPDPLTIAESADIGDAVESLSNRGVRRAPVVNANGTLVGIVTLDDLLPVIADELSSLAKLIGNQARLPPVQPEQAR
jgi:CBS domain-containing protein